MFRVASVLLLVIGPTGRGGLLVQLLQPVAVPGKGRSG